MKKLFLFLSLLLISSAISFADTKSGKCGDDLYWNFDEVSATLTISGTGEMTDYSSGSATPWYNLRIKKVIVEEGVSSLGNCSFLGCTMTSIHLPNTLVKIGHSSFNDCIFLESLNIPKSVTTIYSWPLFYNPRDLSTITVDTENETFYDGNGSNCIIDKATQCLVFGCKNTIIPNTVKKIGEYAFCGNKNITDITIPNSVTYIGKYAFGATSLKSISIPASVTEIGQRAFAEINTLYDVRFEDGTETLKTPHLLGSDNVYVPFYYSRIKKLYVGRNISCGNYSPFYAYDGNIEEVEIGPMVTEFPKLLPNIYNSGNLYKMTSYATEPPSAIAFSSSAYSKCILIVPNGSKTKYQNADIWKKFTICENDDQFSGSVTDEISWSFDVSSGTLTISGKGDLETSPWGAYSNIIKHIDIKEGITGIGSYVFSYHKSLESISLPSSISKLGTYSLFGNDNLVRVDIVDLDGWINCQKESWFISSRYNLYLNKCMVEEVSLNSCKNYAFRCCKSLKKVIIGSNVTSIGIASFIGCVNLESCILPNTLECINDDAFCNTTHLKSISIPKSVTAIGESAFDGSSLETINITDLNKWASCAKGKYWITDRYDLVLNGNTVTKLSNIPAAGDYSFAYCKNIESVSFSNSVTSIGKNAFYECLELVSATLPNTIVSIGDYAFYACPLKTIRMPENLTEIGKGAFKYCTSLTDISLPKTLTYIGYEAFRNCESLQSVVIPSSVTSIGEYVFYGCYALNDVKMPNSLNKIPDCAFGWCKSLTKVCITNTVTAIGYSAFLNCSSLNDIYNYATTPQSIKSDSFSGCGSPIVHVANGCGESYRNADYWKNMKIVEEFLGADVTLSSVGYTTYCCPDGNLDFTNVEGVKAYIASDYDLETGTLTITRVKNVPAGSGVLLIGEGGESYDVPATEKAHIQANLFVGVTDVDKVLEQTEGDYTNYYLSIVDGTVGFYKVAEGHTITIGVGKAYLPIKTSSSAAQSNGFIIEGVSDEVTKINQIVLKDGNDVEGYIDLNGIRTNRLQSGKIYINTKTRNKLFVK